MNRFRIRCTEPFDFVMTATSGQSFRWRETAPGVWSGAEGADWYRVEVDSGWVTGSGTEEAFGELFGLGEGALAAQERIVAAEPRLAEVVAARRGLRVMGRRDAVETLMTFVCSANNNAARIAGMVEHLARRGTEMEAGIWRFPELETVAGLSEEELRGAGFGYRGRTVVEVARATLDRGGRTWLEGLRKREYGEAREALMGLPWIGPKLADCVALFGLGFGEAVPVDTHIWKAATRFYFPEWAGMAVTETRYRAVGERMRGLFGRDAGLAQQFYFHLYFG